MAALSVTGLTMALRMSTGPISRRGSFKFGSANPRDERLADAHHDPAREFGLLGTQ